MRRNSNATRVACSFRSIDREDLAAGVVYTVCEDLVETGIFSEDGHVLVGSAFYVVAEAADGARWASRPCVTSVEWEEEMGPRVTGAREAKRAANALMACARRNPLQARVLDWTPIAPCYGSASWDARAERSQMDDEERAAADKRIGG